MQRLLRSSGTETEKRIVQKRLGVDVARARCSLCAFSYIEESLMKMTKWLALALLVSWGLVGAKLTKAATIEWGAAFEIETEADVDVSKEIVRAVNLADPNTVDVIEVVFPGDIAVEFEPEHTFEFNADLGGVGGGSVTGNGNYYSQQDAGLTTENQDLDRVFDDHGWVGGGPDGGAIAVLELADLVVGTSYQIQLIGAADDRSCCEFRQMTLWNDDLEPVNEDLWFGRSNDFDQDGERGPGSVIGTFTADADTQYINIVGTTAFDDGDGGVGDGADPGLSAYILSLAGGGGLPGDFNGDGVLDATDIDDLTSQSAGGTNPAAYDLNADALVDAGDITVWAKDLFNSWIGDANLDGEFSSGDLVQVLAAGTYEAEVAAVWTSGDFNGDGRADSSDLVAALSDGGYEIGPRAATAAVVPEPASAWLACVGLAVIGWRRRRR